MVRRRIGRTRLCVAWNRIVEIGASALSVLSVFVTLVVARLLTKKVRRLVLVGLVGILASVGYSGQAFAADDDGGKGQVDAGVSAPSSSFDPSHGWFETRSGETQSFEAAYDAWFARRREARYGRAALEVVGLITLGTLYYWFDPLRNGKDYDDNVSIWNRVTLRSFRFDTNLNTTNHLLHPTAGALVHMAARTNGVGMPEAMLYDFGQTLTFEVLLELRERSSINDLVFTSVGGIALGEFLFHTADYFSSAPRGNLGHRIAAWSLGFPRRVHMAIDHEEQPDVAVGTDSLGFTAAYSHGFGVGYEVAALSNDEDRHGLIHRARLDAALIALPGFMRVGSFSTDFGQGNFTALNLRLGFTENRIAETDLQVRSTLFGYYTQHLARSETTGAVNGHAAMLGVGPGLRFQSSSWLGRHDQLSTVHLPGAQAQVWLVNGKRSLTFGAESYPDFGALLALAYPAFTDRYGADGTKFILQRRNYAYSWGSWNRLHGALTWGPVSLSGAAGLGFYRTIQGFDRRQEHVTTDVGGTEQLIELEMEAALRLQSFKLAAGFRERRRASSLATIEVKRVDRDVHFSFGLVF